MKVREFKNITSYEQIISIRKKEKNYRSFVVKSHSRRSICLSKKKHCNK